MNKLSHWGWTIVLAGIYLIILCIQMALYFESSNSYGGYNDMEAPAAIFLTIRIFIAPTFIKLIITAATGALCWLAGENIFKNRNDAFFLPVNCILAANVLLRLIFITQSMFTYLTQ